MLRTYAFIITGMLALTPSTGLPASQAAQQLGLSLLNSGIELRKSQREELERNLVELKRRYDEAIKQSGHTMADLTRQLTQAHEESDNGSDQDPEVLSKKLAILNDRKQRLIDYQELWREVVDAKEARIKALSNFIEVLKRGRPDPKPAYSWKEFRDAQMFVSEQFGKIDTLKTKRDNFRKQKAAIAERLTSLERQQQVKTKERYRLIAQADRKYDSANKSEQIGNAQIKSDAEIIAQELTALTESTEQMKLTIEKLELEDKLYEDLIGYEQHSYNEHKTLLEQIETLLVLDHNDVEIARAEWKAEEANALVVKEKVNEAREPKKRTREEIQHELEVYKQKLAAIKETEKQGNPEVMLIRNQINRLHAIAQALEKDLAHLDAKKDLSDLIAAERELQYNMVKMRYQLKLEDENFTELQAMFNNKRDLALSSLKELKEKRTAAITSLIEANQSIERIKTYQHRLRDGSLAAQANLREHHVRELFGLSEERRSSLGLLLECTQSYLAVNAELITLQEKIIHQYDLILSEIINFKMFSIWKRSPKAISFEALVNGALEIESFFKKLYWQTPTYLRPASAWDLVKSSTMHDVLFILLSLLVYLILLFGGRFLLARLTNYLSNRAEYFKGHTRYLYLQLINICLNFLLKHYTLLFTWLFIYLQLATDAVQTFSVLRPLANTYSVPMFYLLSIPLFTYLAHGFIVLLNDLNTRLNYLFFAERFQGKFIALIGTFCYASAILIPLRMALIAYSQPVPSGAATLILAAYSLMLVVILTLLFSKDDALKFIPTGKPFLIILKRKIDKYYYPVFLFCVGLFILSNPYVGYWGMAWFLMSAVPSSIALTYFLFWLHNVLRKYAVFLFMKEDEDDFVDKFEHAKTYYGFFVVFSFIILLFITFTLVMRIWGFVFTPTDIWRALSEDLVVQLGVDTKIGIIQLLMVSLFIATGFFVSSLIHRFILMRLFDILRSEPGIQNTISRICHYTVIFMSIILGLNAIRLSQLLLWVGASAVVAVGFALKDIGSDLLAGFFVLIERPVEIGNYIQIENVQGTVHRIAARATTIITSKNHSVIIPNRDLVSKWIINWGHGRFAVGFEVNIRLNPTSTDPDAARRLLFATVQANPLILKVPSVVVRLEEIEDNAFVFLVRAFVSSRRVKEQWEIAAALRSEIIKIFKEHNIELARHEYAINLAHNGNQPKAIEFKFDTVDKANHE